MRVGNDALIVGRDSPPYWFDLVLVWKSEVTRHRLIYACIDTSSRLLYCRHTKDCFLLCQLFFLLSSTNSINSILHHYPATHISSVSYSISHFPYLDISMFHPHPWFFIFTAWRLPGHWSRNIFVNPSSLRPSTLLIFDLSFLPYHSWASGILPQHVPAQPITREGGVLHHRSFPCYAFTNVGWAKC